MGKKIELLAVKNNFYKANLHCHSTCSDGKWTPEEVKENYMKQGYQIVAFTDHEVCLDHSDLSDENFLALTGYEIAITEPINFEYAKVYHLNMIAKEPHNVTQVYYDPRQVWGNARQYINEIVPDPSTPNERHYSKETVQAIVDAGNKNGFLVSYNHPEWSMQTAEDYLYLKGLWGVEVINGCSMVCGYDGDSHSYAFEQIIRNGEKVFPLATDDCHDEYSAFIGFLMINSNQLTYSSIIESLEKGDFYASEGPEIFSVCIENGIATLKFSPCRQVSLSTERRCSAAHIQADGMLTEFSFDLNSWFNRTDSEMIKSAYIRFQVTDKQGRSAYTRAYFYEEFSEAFQKK